jgi:hypothetical protein
MTGPERIPVAVLVERRALDNPWTDHCWVVVEVLPDPPDAPAWSVVAEGPGWTRYFAGSADLELYPRETETLKYNLESPEPAVYVFLRRTDRWPGITLLGATVCPGEAHAHADTGTDQVEPVPMPPVITAAVASFVARHHVERPHWKRQRDRADPEALAHRGMIHGPESDEGWDD